MLLFMLSSRSAIPVVSLPCAVRLASMIAHFLIGASRAIFTGRPAIRSGFEMFLVGTGVALVTWVIGKLLGMGL
jgi:VIT1/CCC1 family predicted Fe2+/Mn2+ transporter